MKYSFDKKLKQLPPENMGFVYCLIDPNSELIRYIGITSKSLYARFKGHIYDARRKARKNRKSMWIRNLLKNNQIPIIFLLSVHDRFDLQKAEIDYILLYSRLQGNQKILTNSFLEEQNVFEHRTIKVLRSDGVVFNSVNLAAASVGATAPEITNCLKNRIHHVRNYGWKYFEGRKYSWTPKTVQGLPVLRSDGKIFKNIRAAAKAINRTPTTVCDCLKNKTTSAGGFGFRYFDGKIETWEVPKQDFGRRKMRCSNGKVYPSIKAASSALGISAPSIIKSYKHNKTVKKLSFTLEV